MAHEKFRSITLLLIAEVAALSLWFVSAAVLPDMLRETPMSPSGSAPSPCSRV